MTKWRNNKQSIISFIRKVLVYLDLKYEWEKKKQQQERKKKKILYTSYALDYVSVECCRLSVIF